MTVYGYAARKPELNYCATVRHADGATQWGHVRTNLGRNTAFAMISRNFEGCKIESFREERHMTKYELDQASEA